MSERIEREHGVPQNVFTPALTYILDKEKDWDELLGDLGEVYLAQLLYEFSNDPSPEQTEKLITTALETDDEILIKYIDDVIYDGEEMDENYLKALGDIIVDTTAGSPNRNAAAIRVARKIEAHRELKGSVSYIESRIAQLHESEQANWTPVIFQIHQFYKSMDSDTTPYPSTQKDKIAASDERLNPFRDFINSLDLDDL
jgi:hypothetical protein